MKKYFVWTITFVLSATFSFAQGFKAQFTTLVGNNDTTAQAALLINWHKANPNDPELYVAYYNYYVRKSMHEVLQMTNSQNGKDALVLTDPKSNKPVAYLSGTTSFDIALVDKGFKYIDTGISKYPARLDMRFGKIYVLGKISDYQNFTTEIVKVVEYAQKINLQWTWADGKPVADPKKMMLGAVQDYVNQLYNAGEEQVANMKTIAETVLKYYPDHVESLSDLAITYLIKQDYTQALQPLLKAEKIAPTDAIVLNNIAYCYKGQGDAANAIKYYELTEKYGNDDEKANAQKKLIELRKKQ